MSDAVGQNKAADGNLEEAANIGIIRAVAVAIVKKCILPFFGWEPDVWKRWAGV